MLLGACLAGATTWNGTKQGLCVGIGAIAGACAAARVGDLPRQKLTIAAAMKTLEYVPVMMPTTIVNAKP